MPTALGEDAMSTAGTSAAGGLLQRETERSNAARNEGRQHAKRKQDSRQKGRNGKISKKSREWILIKKDNMRKNGREVAHDSKYTGRKRNKIRW